MSRLSWDEMVIKYPDQWIAVKNAEMDGADIVSGEVVIALYDREMRKYRIGKRKTGLVFRRTSEGDYNGYITSDIGIRIDPAV